MKPAPFENINFVDKNTQIQLTSELLNDDGSETNGITKIKNPNGKILWEMKRFIGRHEINISPNGQIVALTGNYYFTSKFNINGNSPILTLYENGKIIKKVDFSDLFQENAEEIAKKRKLTILGGGWVSQKDFIKKINFDWKKRITTFYIWDNSTKAVTF